MRLRSLHDEQPTGIFIQVSTGILLDGNMDTYDCFGTCIFHISAPRVD